MKIKLIKISIVVDIINNVRQSTTTVATRSSLKHKVQNTIELYQPYVFIEKLSILSITLQRFFSFSDERSSKRHYLSYTIALLTNISHPSAIFFLDEK